MNFKYLDRKLDRILNETTGFGFTSRAEELPDKLQELIDKYGNLTIPEFIDKLIKEKENLAEGYAFSYFPNVTSWNSVNNLNISSKFFTFKERTLQCKVNDKLYSNFEVVYIYTKVQNGYLVQLILDQQRWKDTSDSKYDNLIIEGLKEFSKDIQHDNQSGASHYYYFVVKKFRLQALGENVESVIREQFEQCLKELLTVLDAKYEQQNKSLEDEYELVEIKKTVKNKNIKVKQALSKSSVAKKIQALQNPTPEQLAKILAAIEE